MLVSNIVRFSKYAVEEIDAKKNFGVDNYTMQYLLGLKTAFWETWTVQQPLTVSWSWASISSHAMLRLSDE